MSDRVVIIRPRGVVSADAVRSWLERNFQQPGTEDAGMGTAREYTIHDGNPLVNASIEAAPPVDEKVREAARRAFTAYIHERDLMGRFLRAAGIDDVAEFAESDAAMAALRDTLDGPDADEIPDALVDELIEVAELDRYENVKRLMVRDVIKRWRDAT